MLEASPVNHSDLPPDSPLLVGTQREYSTLPILSPENRKPVGYVAIEDLLKRLDAQTLRAEDPLSTSMRKFATKEGYQGEAIAYANNRARQLTQLFSYNSRYRYVEIGLALGLLLNDLNRSGGAGTLF